MAIDIASARNVLGGPLRACSYAPITGFFRDGCCRTRRDDVGLHVVCVKVTADFLAFSATQGNDLSTPMPEARFPGLRPGDRWCLCASRWLEAYRAGKAPLVVLESTHEQALEVIPLEALKEHALPPSRPLDE